MRPRTWPPGRWLLLATCAAFFLAVLVAFGATIWAGHDNVWLPLGALLWACSGLRP